jgi:hypothetical protein
MAATVTLIAVSAKSRRPASFDGGEYLYLWPGEAFPKAKHESPAGLADDISHLPGWPFH